MVYATDADDAMCVCRWYPHPRAAEGYRGGVPSLPVVEGHSADDWERRIVASSAYTASFHSCYRENIDLMPERDARINPPSDPDPYAFDLAAFTDATAPGPGPRDWHGAVPEDGGSWLQLWKEPVGSLDLSVVVRVADFETGDLNRYRVVCWQ